MALDLIVIAGFTWLILRTERILTVMGKTRQDLDNSIAALPGIISAAVTTSVEAVVNPIIAKLEGTPAPEDFSAEIASLSNLGTTVATSVASAVSASLTPSDTSGTGDTTGTSDTNGQTPA